MYEKYRSVVRSVFDRTIAGEPQDSIALTLHLMRDVVQGTIPNPFYAGMVAYGIRDEFNRGVPMEQWDYHPAINFGAVLTFDEWLAAQTQSYAKSHGGKGRAAPLLAKLLYCGACRHILTAYGHQGALKRYTRYSCDAGPVSRPHRNRHVWEHHVLPLVVDAMVKAVMNLEITTGNGALLAANDVAVSETEKHILNAKARLLETNV